MRIAIVANGSSLLRLKVGKEIDAHDLVIRQNLYYELLDPEITGTKVDIWSCAFDDCRLYDDEERSKEVWCARPRSWENGAKWNIRIKSERIKREINEGEYGRIALMVHNTGGTNPTTGFLTLKFAQKIYPDAEIDLYGYDFYEPLGCYYSDDIPELHKDHSPKIEKKLVIEGVNKGEYKWIQ